MEIQFPKRYWLALGMLVKEGFYGSRIEAATAVFYDGLADAVEDVVEGGEHLIDESFLTGTPMLVEVPDTPSRGALADLNHILEDMGDPEERTAEDMRRLGEHLQTASGRLTLLCEVLSISANEASAIAFAYGLTIAYAQLAASPRYRTSAKFRARVNRLPHYVEDDPDAWEAMQAEAAGQIAIAEREDVDLDDLPPGVSLDTMSREELDAWVDQQLRLEEEEGR